MIRIEIVLIEETEMDISSISSNAFQGAKGGAQSVGASGGVVKPFRVSEGPQGQAASPRGGAPVQGQNIEDVVADINSKLQEVERSLQFSVDKDTNRTIVKVVDSKTDEVIKQFPPETVLDMAKQIDEFVDNMSKGVLVREEA